MGHGKRLQASESALILVADADRKAARDLAGYFSIQGFQASHTSRGEEVLRFAHSGGLGLAIVDASLLDMSGHALASRLKEIDPEIPVLMTSGDYHPELEIRARQAGILYYSHKPADYRLLKAVVTKLLSDGGSMNSVFDAGHRNSPEQTLRQ